MDEGWYVLFLILERTGGSCNPWLLFRLSLGIEYRNLYGWVTGTCMTCPQVYCALVIVAAGTRAAVIVLVCRRASREWLISECRTMSVIDGNLAATERNMFEFMSARTSRGSPQGSKRARRNPVLAAASVGDVL